MRPPDADPIHVGPASVVLLRDPLTDRSGAELFAMVDDLVSNGVRWLVVDFPPCSVQTVPVTQAGAAWVELLAEQAARRSLSVSFTAGHMTRLLFDVGMSLPRTGR